MPLTENYARHHDTHQVRLEPLAAKAGVHLFMGALACRDAAGLAVPGTDAAQLSLVGVVREELDNSGGPDGYFDPAGLSHQRVTDADISGSWSLSVQGVTPTPGQTAYVVDDTTVTAAPTTHSVAAGTFQQPSPFAVGEWMVRID